MKLVVLLLFTSFTAFSQITPEEFANVVFSACMTNDITGFQENLAPGKEIGLFLKSIDASITDEQVLLIYPKYKENAMKGFRLFQSDAATLELDFTTIKITKTEVEDRPIELIRNGKMANAIKTKSIKIFFTCSGKNMCFMISDGMKINEKWFLGEQIVQLHWLD